MLDQFTILASGVPLDTLADHASAVLALPGADGAANTTGSSTMDKIVASIWGIFTIAAGIVPFYHGIFGKKSGGAKQDMGERVIWFAGGIIGMAIVGYAGHAVGAIGGVFNDFF